MADDAPDAESKTEDPTPRRREEARRRGQVPFSAEVVGSSVLLAGILGLMYLGPSLWMTMSEVYKHDLARIGSADFNSGTAQELLLRAFIKILSVLLPMFGIMLAVGIAASVAQVGFEITTEKLEPDIDRLNPANGFQRLFSLGAVVKGVLAIFKIAGLSAIAYVILNPRVGQILMLSRDQLGGTTLAAWSLVTRLAMALAAVVAGVSVLDYIYQRYRFEQSLKMTKQELKDELKQEDGDPMIKNRIRQIARERARQRMLAEVPTATVVVTNPTHYAVALRYRSNEDASPVLVAKGAGRFAERISQIARSHSVPVVERPPLTRALYATVREGEPIPGALFLAVAEVIAFVYRLRGIGQHNRPGPI